MNRLPFTTRLAVVAALALLSACGGGGGEGAAQEPPVAPPPPPPPPVVNQPPVASFTAPATAVAGNPVALDASASSDPENGALIHHWDFGDASHGGQARQAHLYAQPGNYTARLTVTDPQGLSSSLTRLITITPGPVAARSVQANGLITDTAGQPLAGVQVAVQGSNTVATSDAQGRVALTLGVGVDVTLRLTRTGLAEQVKVLKLPSMVGQDAYFEASLMPRAAAQTLADAAAGGSLVGVDGAGLTLPANALQDAQGNPVTGAVQVTMTPVDINRAAVAAFPGRFEGLNLDGSVSPIVSYGTTEYTLTQGGRAMQLKPGARATLLLPLYASAHLNRSNLAAGDTIPLWSLHEASGRWVLEGHGTVVPATASPTGWAMRADVGHFSWWNADLQYTPFKPKPKCINDVPGQYDNLFAQAMICKMLAEMDKPIPAQQAARVRPLSTGRSTTTATPERTPQAEPAPRFPFPAARIEADLPMATGGEFPVPPDFDVALVATALNGTWRGRVVVRGAEGARADVNVPLRPLNAGSSNEAITLPFDATRSAAAARVDRYTFSATAGQGVVITAQASLSTLRSAVRLRDGGGNLLAAGRFTGASQTHGDTPANLRFQVPVAGEYTVELEPQANAPGAYRLQVATAAVAQRLNYSDLTDPAEAISGPSVPQLASNTQGQAMAAWHALGNSGQTLWVSSYLGDTLGWGAAVAVATGRTVREDVGLQLGLDDAGNATLAWDEGRGPVVARRDATTGQWGAPQALASTACAGGQTQRLAVSRQGAVMLLWQRSSPAGLCARRLPADANVWSTEQAFDTTIIAPGFLMGGTVPVGAQLALAANARGDAVATWVLAGDAFTTGAKQGMRFLSASGAWGPTVAVGSGTGHRNPAVTLDAQGTALAIWGQFNNQNQVRAALWPAANAAWDVMQDLGAWDGAHADAVATAPGRFQLMWNRRGVGFNPGAVTAMAVDLNTTPVTWSAAQAVATERFPIFMRLVTDGAGNAAAAWLANAPTGGVELAFARLDANGSWVAATPRIAPKVVATSAGQVFTNGTLGLAVGGARVHAVWREFIPGVTTPLLLGGQAPSAP